MMPQTGNNNFKLARRPRCFTAEPLEITFLAVSHNSVITCARGLDFHP
jgi:hypothetical protein